MEDKITLYVEDIVHETADTITIHFRKSDFPRHYLSGQFLTLIAEINGKEERRAYSLCSSPYIDSALAVTIKRIKGGKMSNYLHDMVKVGDTLTALPPMGNFNFDPGTTSRHIVLVGCGSGITPLFSIIKTALVKEPSSMISLVYVNSNRANTIFYDQLEQWRAQCPSRFRIAYYWGDEWKRKQSHRNFLSRLFKKNAHRINPKRLKSNFSEWQLSQRHPTVFYVCGPHKLMEMVKATIMGLGYERSVVHSESFYAHRKTKPSQQTHPVEIRFKGEAHAVNVPTGTSILFAGLEAGLDLPYSCQSGNCVSCTGKCLSGSIVMDTTDGLTAEEIENGYVLTCIGYPQSDDVVIEF